MLKNDTIFKGLLIKSLINQGSFFCPRQNRRNFTFFFGEHFTRRSARAELLLFFFSSERAGELYRVFISKVSGLFACLKMIPFCSHVFQRDVAT